MRKTTLAAALVLALLPGRLFAVPVTLVDTGTHVGGFGSSWIGVMPTFWNASEFNVSGGPYIITDVQTYMEPTTAGDLTVSLYADGGDVPGLLLYQEDFAVAEGGEDWRGFGPLSWTVGPGSYWVAFEVLAGSTYTGWALMGFSNPLPNDATSNGEGEPWNSHHGLDLGIRILANDEVFTPPAVPEPSSFLLMGSGLLVGAYRLRRTARR